MAIFDNGLKGNIVAGLAIGVGAAVLAPILAPILASIAKPLAKAAIKGGLMLTEKGKEVFAEMKEVTEDLVAEASAELEEEIKVKGAVDQVVKRPRSKTKASIQKE